MSASVALTPEMSFLESSTHPRPTPMTLFDPLAVIRSPEETEQKPIPQNLRTIRWFPQTSLCQNTFEIISKKYLK
ncbi:hypothetical protein CEXT_350901 [Caerostris extrusa]|uniref:Uncharacterized protein n=1 Tax=Caerostris extrusa TaxID=172846 RepID=A0AAV4Q8N9_CAEEX|nr:hypothetical protein CEXT_350901 [Caerostris extrusa]